MFLLLCRCLTTSFATLLPFWCNCICACYSSAGALKLHISMVLKQFYNRLRSPKPNWFLAWDLTFGISWKKTWQSWELFCWHPTGGLFSRLDLYKDPSTFAINFPRQPVYFPAFVFCSHIEDSYCENKYDTRVWLLYCTLSHSLNHGFLQEMYYCFTFLEADISLAQFTLTVLDMKL